MFAFSLSLALASVASTLGLAHADKPAVFVDRFQPAAAGGYDVVSFFSGAPAQGVECLCDGRTDAACGDARHAAAGA